MIYVHAAYILMLVQLMYLLDIPRQPTSMKLHVRTRELYLPIQSCHVFCLGISNKYVAVPR